MTEHARTDAVDGTPTASDSGLARLDVRGRLDRMRATTWWALLRHTVPVYVLSRLCVLAGAAVVAAELRVDANLADEGGLPLADPHGAQNAGSAIRPILDVFASWDGLWYMDIVREGYPTEIVPDVTYFDDSARAAFFPLFPLLGRWFDRIVPGGDTLAVLVMNTILGLIAIVLFALIAHHLYGNRVARRTATLAALFPGSFVLSFAYSEALFLVLAAGCLLMLLYTEWTAAGVFAALATATRPNGVALVAACVVAAYFAIRERRDWHALIAVLLAPLGFITFQVWLGQHTGEAGAWFRVQREAWDEGASFGWTAVRNTLEAVVQPMTSPTDTITALSFVATILLLVLAWKAKLPWVLTAYAWAIVALMLVPATVTARPRFLYTAFPLLIGAARWYEDRSDRDETIWPSTLAACGAGLAALTGLYGVFGAIP